MVFGTIDEKNVFIDSETGVVGGGTDFRCNFPAEMFSVKDPDHIRLTLKQFNMKKNIGNLYHGNNFIWLIADDNTGVLASQPYPVIMKEGNYVNMEQIGTAFVNAVNETFALGAVGFDFNGFSYPANGAMSAGGGSLKCSMIYNTITRGWEFKLWQNDQTTAHLWGGATFYFVSMQVTNPTGLNVKNAVANGFFSVGGTVPPFGDVLINPMLQTQGVFQDAGALWGGRASREGNALPPLQAMWNDTSSGTQTKFESPFMSQLSTMDKIFLRTSLQTENCQSLGFDTDSGSAKGQIVGSMIFATIPYEVCCSSAVNNLGNAKFNIGNVASPVWTSGNPFLPPEPFNPTTGQVDPIMPNFETVHWEDQSGSSIFTMLIDGQQLGQIRFFLTDAKGRLLVGSDPSEVISGNLNFKMVIRYEAVEIGRVGYLSNQISFPIPVVDELQQSVDFQTGKMNPLSS